MINDNDDNNNGFDYNYDIDDCYKYIVTPACRSFPDNYKTCSCKVVALACLQPWR